MNKSLVVWKRVFKEKKYIITTLIVALAFYLLNGIIINVPNIKSFYSLLGFSGALKVLSVGAFRFVDRLTTFNAITTIILSLLIGALVSLLVFRFKMATTEKAGKIGLFGSLGIFLGMAAPGCAACGVGLLAILGLSSALFVLPFQGHEINVVAIALVSFSIFNISGKLYNPVCQIKINENDQ